MIEAAIVSYWVWLLQFLWPCLTSLFPRLSRNVPLTVAIVNVPFVAVAPILFIVLGYGSEAKIFIVALVRFFLLCRI